MENINKRYMNIEDLEVYLGIPKSTLYKMVENLEIPFNRVGTKTIRFDVRVIDAWMEKKTVKPANRENKFFVPDNGVDRMQKAI